MIGTDLIKLNWASTPYPVSDPIGLADPSAGLDLSVYRILIVVSAVLLFLALRLFFKRSIIGQIVTASLEDSDGVRCLGLDVNRYFSIVFVLGSALAVWAASSMRRHRRPSLTWGFTSCCWPSPW